MSDKTFIAISTEIVNNKLIYINTSNGRSLTDDSGISTMAAIEFLHNLAKENRKTGVVFVCYAFQRDTEFIFKDLPDDLKDELMQSHSVKKEIDELQTQREDLEAIYYDKRIELTESESIEYYNRIQEINLALTDAGKIKYNGYKVTLMQGKQIIINKNNVPFVLYDVFGYFRKPLSEIVQKFFQIQTPLLAEKKSDILEIRKAQNAVECFYICKLLNYLNSELKKYGINLTRFSGAGTITTAVLSKAGAKKEYKSFNRKYSLSEETRKIVNSAFYGARTEQFKLGKFQNVNVYDLNSAYAKAVMFLPKMLRRPAFSSVWNSQPFSCWFVEYNLPKNLRYGLLPNRDTSQLVRYKPRGKGYFWQPEVVFLLQNYPDCIEVKHGIFVPYEQANFTQAIFDLYELRKQLKQQNNPLEKVLKLALAVIYGKFCQRVGFAYWNNLFYAGFITSYVRSQLLQATFGNESKTICYLTDAIHTTAKLNVPISDELGEFRHTKFDEGVYLGAGIYHLTNKENAETKQATRGFTHLDFNDALNQISETGVFKAFQDYFIGHNLTRLAPVEFGEYLQFSRKAVKVSPFESKVRLFSELQADLRNEQIESQIFDTFSGRESLEYKPKPINDNKDLIFDAIAAGKV